ncbi:unnamed protein product [Adineta steineri]|uniref:Uncharacterized protein n=1 Tax=Adineta steineri TaxID=433720 RepID=A0A814PHC9_9BILA|nr:unnamed protein product [Adineta steineri]CAF3719397.1 unnamed protein product [Adineta steineri]
MNARTIISLCIFVFQQLFFVKIEARDVCYYLNTNSTTMTINCNDGCCSAVAMSPDTACCSTISWGSVAIPFFVFMGVCILAVCVVYCRPVWKACLCGWKCPCSNPARVSTPLSASTHNNPIYIVNNDDLPDYETIIKDAPVKDGIPPPYNFVTTHPTDFGIETRIPSAPPQYHSRRSSSAIIQSNIPNDP